MKNYYSLIYITLLSIIISFSQAEKTVINILTKQPDMPETANVEEWEINYENLINEYLKEQSKGNPILSDVEVSFAFYEYLPIHEKGGSVYFKYLYEVTPELGEGAYDMMILDERILFSEMSFMETDLVEFYFEHRLPSIEIFHPLSEYVKKEDIDFSDSKIISDGMHEGIIYGLPYELDFDVMYYNDQNEDSLSIVDKMNTLTWDDLLKLIQSSTPNTQSIGLGDDNDLINLLIEYTNCQYELSKEYDPKYYEVFYNKTGEELFTNFYNFMSSYTNGDVNESTRITLDDAFNDFVQEKSMFYKGKASHRNIIRTQMENTNNTYSYTLPPKYKTAVNEKYLSVNTYSKLDKKLLSEVAIALTSREAQIYRANNFGSIPTFDITKNDSDPIIKSYCTDQPHICNIIQKIDRIYVKDILKNEKSSPFIEVESFFPKMIRSYLTNNNIEDIIFGFKNMFLLLTEQLGIFGLLAYIVIFGFSLFFLVIMVLIYKQREHPYLKVISPIFCIMIILGTTMNMIKYIQYLPPYTTFTAKFYYVYEGTCTNLIYIPMFAVTYRIFRIFRTKLFMSKALNNKRLFIGILVAIIIVIAFRIYVTFKANFYYLPFGSLRFTRFPEYVLEGADIYDSIYYIYLHGIFIALLFMMITTGKISKKFGDISYVFVIFSLNISDFIVRRLLEKLSHVNYPKYFFLIIIFNCLVSFFCIHFLIGSRLLFVLIYPSDFTKSQYKVSTMDSGDLREFIPLRSKKAYRNLIKKFKENVSFKSKASSDNLLNISEPYNVKSPTNKNFILYNASGTQGLSTGCISSNYGSINQNSQMNYNNNVHRKNIGGAYPSSPYSNISSAQINYNSTSPFLSQSQEYGSYNYSSKIDDINY
ncbi:hypothetical protein PIROE2DRAFT_13663 [Piromyces sp. E2]|nr:hypothetical protein PIROE2DRAFT_13663 [Piromyces sp. E2]|eukprot:OUM60547.1 hypothetical protein PIROE2DRAFT_13663 [Piromyces sp. E2]